jgi:hypothetical protein
MTTEERTTMATVSIPTTTPTPTPAAPPLPSGYAWLEQAEQYLEFKGWERTSTDGRGRTLWRDPLCAGPHRADRSVEIQLPAVGGGIETIRQWKGPPADWFCTTEVAMQIQLARDQAGPGGEAASPLARLDRLGQRYDTIRLAFDNLLDGLKGLARRSTPEAPDGLRREFQLRHNQLVQLLAAAETAVAQGLRG